MAEPQGAAGKDQVHRWLASRRAFLRWIHRGDWAELAMAPMMLEEATPGVVERLAGARVAVTKLEGGESVWQQFLSSERRWSPASLWREREVAAEPWGDLVSIRAEQLGGLASIRHEELAFVVMKGETDTDDLTKAGLCGRSYQDLEAPALQSLVSTACYWHDNAIGYILSDDQGLLTKLVQTFLEARVGTGQPPAALPGISPSPDRASRPVHRCPRGRSG